MSSDLQTTLASLSDKLQVQAAVADFISDRGLTVTEVDFNKPWGGYFRIGESDAEVFISQFFPGQTQSQISRGLSLTPKILVVAPYVKLSWQYHFRREEIWCTLVGPVGYVTSNDDNQGEMQILHNNEIVSFGAKVRHRLVGREQYGIVAEFWKHIDPENPSEEADIVRVQDDFNRN